MDGNEIMLWLVAILFGIASGTVLYICVPPSKVAQFFSSIFCKPDCVPQSSYAGVMKANADLTVENERLRRENSTFQKEILENSNRSRDTFAAEEENKRLQTVVESQKGSILKLHEEMESLKKDAGELSMLRGQMEYIRRKLGCKTTDDVVEKANHLRDINERGRVENSRLQAELENYRGSPRAMRYADALTTLSLSPDDKKLMAEAGYEDSSSLVQDVMPFFMKCVKKIPVMENEIKNLKKPYNLSAEDAAILSRVGCSVPTMQKLIDTVRAIINERDKLSADLSRVKGQEEKKKLADYIENSKLGTGPTPLFLPNHPIKYEPLEKPDSIAARLTIHVVKWLNTPEWEWNADDFVALNAAILEFMQKLNPPQVLTY